MSTRPHGAGGKPLSSRSFRGIFPVVFVDVSPRSGNPAKPDPRERAASPELSDEDQAVLAAQQWGSDMASSRGWLRSWYYPSDKFDPWPDRTDLRCWHCTHTFPNTPFPLPWSYNTASKKWRVKGLFCGPSCCKAYVIEHDLSFKANVLAWIEEIARKYYGYKPKEAPDGVIPVAPRREILKEYCGPNGFDIQQFRKACFHGRSITLHRPGFITVKQIVEAEQRTATDHRARGGVSHKESPDKIVTTKELTQVKREIFVAKGTRRIGDFLKCS